MAFDIFGLNYDTDKEIKYDNHTTSIDAGDFNKILAANNLYAEDDCKWYTKFNRYGWVYPQGATANREYLFFTKPDLNIFDSNYALNESLQKYPIFTDAYKRFNNSMRHLQSTYGNTSDSNPFMCLLSNAVSSRLDLPGISSESIESTSNMYGSAIAYRSHSLKSDNGFDFNLSFTDTKYLEIYMMVKLYDEYIRLQKLGYIRPKKKYIVNRILSDQFSIYKFIVADDGESILYFAKVTGVYFTDVPRSDMSDPGQDGFKFSLSFHGQFIEDSNPSILADFNALTGKKAVVEGGYAADFSIIKDSMNVYNNELSIVNNEWAGLPYIAIEKGTKRATKRSRDGHGDYYYLLKWRK